MSKTSGKSDTPDQDGRKKASLKGDASHEENNISAFLERIDNKKKALEKILKAFNTDKNTSS